MSEQWTKEQIDRAMERIFFVGRDPRSPEYVAGCRAALERSTEGCPYSGGTPQSDAWWSGREEGMSRRKHIELFQEVEP